MVLAYYLLFCDKDPRLDEWLVGDPTLVEIINCKATLQNNEKVNNTSALC